MKRRSDKAMKGGAAVLLAVLALVAAGCQSSTPNRTEAPAAPPPSQAPAEEEPAEEPASEPFPPRDDIYTREELAETLRTLDQPDPDRWLSVEKVEDGTPGGWATADFDAERNKLSIDTERVEAFALDLSRVPVDWERLVVLSIDGRNSELARRDHSVYHFRRDRQQGWVVVE